MYTELLKKCNKSGHIFYTNPNKLEEVTINQRINILIETFCKGNKSSFARDTGISTQSLSEITGLRQSSPSFANLQKIAQAFPQVRRDWLLLGEGGMMVNAPAAPIFEESQNISSYSPDHLHADLERDLSEDGMPSYNLARKPKPKPEAAPLLGLDLIKQVNQNTADIRRLLTLLDQQPVPERK